jgi:membrane protein DedA with SNARE-associated domain
MFEGVVDVIRELASSPWIYVGLFLIAAVDGFFPLVPSESAVVTVGVFAATGDAALGSVIASAAGGAIVGDHVSYALGRAARSRLAGGDQRSRRGKALAWAKRVLARRGGVVIVVARYVPGGRVAATMTAGSVGYPLRRFTPFAAVAGVTWAIYTAMIGFIGGAAFEDDPVKALLLGFALAASAALLVEAGRHLVRRHRRDRGLAPNSSQSSPAGADNCDSFDEGVPISHR